MMNLYSYGRGTRAHAVRIGEVTLYFSYQTIVGFSTPWTGTVVSENVWGRTTGNHINAIGGREVPHATFEKLLDEALSKYGLKGV